MGVKFVVPTNTFTTYDALKPAAHKGLKFRAVQ
jgi:hypothetical protein